MVCQKVTEPQGLCWVGDSNTYVNDCTDQSGRGSSGTFCDTSTRLRCFNGLLWKSLRHGGDFTYLYLCCATRCWRWPLSYVFFLSFFPPLLFRVLFLAEEVFGGEDGPCWVKWPGIDEQSGFILAPRTHWGKTELCFHQICKRSLFPTESCIIELRKR